MNPITLIDGYKLDHRRQYPDKTTGVYSNWTPRESRVPSVNRVVFFGLQFALQYVDRQFARFFGEDVDQVAASYTRRVNGYLGPNKIGVDHIRSLHALGYLPLEFRAVPEGTHVPLRVPMMTVESTHPDFAWLVNYMETLLSSLLWMPCTSATNAGDFRRVLEQGALATGSPLEFVDWQGHDFSFRGMPGPDAAAMSGAGHLLFFTGTDTIPAIDFVEEFYSMGHEGELPDTYLIGGSVAATEHSVMCAGGKEDELGTFNRLLELYPEGIVSVVSDTWDLWNVCTNILPQLKDRIMARPGKLVIRPDSGNPVDIVAGDPAAPAGSPASKGVIELLWEVFGGTTTDSGFKVLDSHIGCIYGDSITRTRAKEIIQRLMDKGFASCNMVFGIGSFTYQYVTRDTFGFAMKATDVEINGVHHAIFKKPVTGDGMKNSAKGRLAVIRSEDDGELILLNEATPAEEAVSELKLVWRNGAFIRRENFATIRARARSGR